MSARGSLHSTSLALTLAAGLATEAAPATALDAFPKTTLAEDATATWCGYCPDAYAGLEVVHFAYDYGTFVSARYYDPSGQYGSSETAAAIAYYQVFALPTVILNGRAKVVGDIIASGASYLPVVEAASFQPAPIRIEIDFFDPASGDIRATVTMYSEAEVLANDHIRLLLLEDDLDARHTHVTRDIINDTISLSGAGNTAVFTATFDVDPGWNPANLHAVVFVQRAADKEVLQADSTYDEPHYAVRAMVPFGRVTIGPSSGTHTSPRLTLMNVGFADTFTVDLIVDQAPSGWSASYRDDQGATHTGQWSFVLGPEESAELSVDVTPGSPGSMTVHLEVSSPNLAAPLVIPFTYVTDDAGVLIVDDDGSEDYEGYFTAALESLGWSYAVWDRAAGTLPDEVLQAYPLLIWQVGECYPTLDADDRRFLSGHLDAGGSLLLTGQDIGWDLNDWLSVNTDAEFFETYLHATYLRHGTGIVDLDGVAGDPITDGLSLHIAGGDGADNQELQDEIARRDADATPMFDYRGDGVAAIRAADSASGARIVYLSFGFEAIDNAQDRAELLGRALEWLDGHGLLYRRPAGRRLPGGPSPAAAGTAP